MRLVGRRHGAGGGQRFPPGAQTTAQLLSLRTPLGAPRWRKRAISGSSAAFTYRCRPEGGPTPQIGQTGRSDRECARKLLLSGGGAATNVSPDALTMSRAYSSRVNVITVGRSETNTDL